MRVVCISDTHNRLFRPIALPPGDVLVHAGDLCLDGNMEELEKATKWLASTEFPVVVVIAGNHDFPFQDRNQTARTLLASKGIIYLQDEEVSIKGLKFYGSPWTPTFYQWAFMKDRGPEIRAKWDQIPRDTDVLITHGPPHGVLDKNVMWGDMVGCEELKDVVFNHLPQLKLHVFGHIHEGYGQWMDMNGHERPIHFVNASICNEAYSPINQPVVVEL